MIVLYVLMAIIVAIVTGILFVRDDPYLVGDAGGQALMGLMCVFAGVMWPGVLVFGVFWGITWVIGHGIIELSEALEKRIKITWGGK